MNHEPSRQDPVPKPFWSSRYAIGYLVFGGIALYYLLTEHRAHVIGALPWLIILSCPLMHLFMHHGHGGHHPSHGHRDDADASPHGEHKDADQP